MSPKTTADPQENFPQASLEFLAGPSFPVIVFQNCLGGGVSMIHQATVRSKMPHASSEAIVFQWGSKSRMKDNNVS